MKRGKINLCKLLYLSVVGALLLSGCNSFLLNEQEPGSITLSIAGLNPNFYSDGIYLKSDIDTDTNNFILTIYSTGGEKIYDGLYGERPEEIVVTPGGYDVGLYSKRFNPPMFDTPVFGDEQLIVVGENEQAKVSFNCTQVNAGVKFTFANDFKAEFPGSGIYIGQGEEKLAYDYSETKYAYVSTDEFQLLYNKSGVDTVLLAKQLNAGQMLNLKLTYSASRTTASVFKIDIDTTRDWVSYNYNVGLRIPTGAISIEEAKGRIGEKNVKVFGYIFGGDPSTTSIRVGPPFESNTSIVIAPGMSERNRANMFVVELPSGSIRDALNLVNNPDNLGRAVVVTGTIVESYYGYPGIKSTKSYALL